MTRLQYIFGLGFCGAMAFAGSLAANLLMRADVVHAQQDEVVPVLKAREFQLVDGQSRVRSRLHLNKEDAQFDMLDDKGGVRVRAEAGALAGLSIRDGDGKDRYGVGYQADEDMVGQTFLDAGGNIRIMTTLEPKRGALFAMQQGEGKKQVAIQAMDGLSLVQLVSGKHEAHMSALKDSTGLFVIKHADTVRYRIATTSKGSPELLMNDENGKYRFVAALTDANIPVLGLGDGEKVRLRAMVDGNSRPSLQFLDNKMNPTWEAK